MKFPEFTNKKNTTAAPASKKTATDSMDSKFANGIEDMFLGDNMHPTFDTFYTLTKKLQGGSYGTVFIGVHKLRKREYAVKVVDRRYVNIICERMFHMHIYAYI